MTSSSSDTFTPTPAPYIPNWIPVLVLVLFGCGILGLMYWGYNMSAGKLPSTKNIVPQRAALRRIPLRPCPDRKPRAERIRCPESLRALGVQFALLPTSSYSKSSGQACPLLASTFAA
ncbi:hypothetical protein DFH09DRAFT_1325089 [Mycena vulgaris]|nr:hypothetical protein DFH09DRAFT_1327704 [Mycena vulgaris]KAJ6535260.1 hypothetical protein DFH09DRAFT_1325089 [Mycena vulgaris]